ncbi:MAG TPA: septum formation initiator family protein [Clostridiaceae bacterium]
MDELNEKFVINGNTVLAPNYMPYRESEQKRQVRKNSSNKKNIHKKIIVIRNIMIAFIVGITLVGRYCIIYNLQSELNTTKQNIAALNKENENLKVDLVKYNNIQYIEDVAVNKLGMVTPDRNDAIYADVSKKTIISAESKSNEGKNAVNALAEKIF